MMIFYMNYNISQNLRIISQKLNNTFKFSCQINLREKKKKGQQIFLQLMEDKYIIDLNQFTIIRNLGQGGFGEVYLVESNETKNKYAAKIS